MNPFTIRTRTYSSKEPINARIRRQKRFLGQFAASACTRSAAACPLPR